MGHTTTEVHMRPLLCHTADDETSDESKGDTLLVAHQVSRVDFGNFGGGSWKTPSTQAASARVPSRNVLQCNTVRTDKIYRNNSNISIADNKDWH